MTAECFGCPSHADLSNPGVLSQNFLVEHLLPFQPDHCHSPQLLSGGTLGQQRIIEVEGISTITESNLSCSMCRGGTSQGKSQSCSFSWEITSSPHCWVCTGQLLALEDSRKGFPTQHSTREQRSKPSSSPWVFPGGFLLTGGELFHLSVPSSCAGFCFLSICKGDQKWG